MYTTRELTSITEQELGKICYPAEPAWLYEPIQYTLQEGGKRLRPLLTLMACNLFSEQIERAIPSALAVEVFHNFTLLHDDIMDQADTRRGRAAVHKRWNNNVAILSGDAMMIFAYRLLGNSPTEILPQLLATFNRVAMGVCEGQQWDMDFEGRERVSVAEYLGMIELKTAVLLAGALHMGARCGGATEEQIDLLYRFGIELGLVFQLQDDLLDTYGDAATFGKPIGGDILVGKKTFLLTNAISLASTTQLSHLQALLRNTEMVPQMKIDAVRTLYDELSICTLTQEAVTTHSERALTLLSSLSAAPHALPAERLSELNILVHNLLKRTK